MYIPLLSLAALFGASQGLLLGIIVLSLQRGNTTANRLLACFLFAESMRLSVLMFTYGDWVLASPWLYLPLNISYAIGPLLYGYTRAMTQPDFRLQTSMSMHLLPILLATIICSVFFSTINFDDIDPLEPEQSQAFWWGTLLAITSFASLLIYAILSLRLLKPYREMITAEFSAIEKINLQWLKLLIVFCLLTAAISATIELTRLSTDLNMGPRILASLLMSVIMIYGIGIMGLRQPAILGLAKWAANSPSSNNPQQHASKADTSKAESTATEKYLKSGLNATEAEILWEKLQHYMQEYKPYLENGLKLSDLAEQMDLIPNHLSQIINSYAGKTFFDFINGYRVEAAKQLLSDKDKQHLAVASIALDAGFNSQNTFYNQFKKHTGTTPSKYKKLQLSE